MAGLRVCIGRGAEIDQLMGILRKLCSPCAVPVLPAHRARLGVHRGSCVLEGSSQFQALPLTPMLLNQAGVGAGACCSSLGVLISSEQSQLPGCFP